MDETQQSPANQPINGDTPVLVGTSTEDAVSKVTLPLKPFYSQYDRRSAVYFPRLTDQQWQVEQKTRAAETQKVSPRPQYSARSSPTSPSTRRRPYEVSPPTPTPGDASPRARSV
jgi:hypothetical protein